MQAEKTKRGLEFPMNVVGLKGECIDMPTTENGSFDVIISTHVLCSVDVPELVLTNADLALKPGGRFIFMEHVTADYDSSPLLWYAQQIFAPILFILGNGCKFRSTEMVITSYFKNNDRFDLEFALFDGPMPFFLGFLKPHIMGLATKKS